MAILISWKGHSTLRSFRCSNVRNYRNIFVTMENFLKHHVKSLPYYPQWLHCISRYITWWFSHLSLNGSQSLFKFLIVQPVSDNPGTMLLFVPIFQPKRQAAIWTLIKAEDWEKPSRLGGEGLALISLCQKVNFQHVQTNALWIWTLTLPAKMFWVLDHLTCTYSPGWWNITKLNVSVLPKTQDG